MLSTACRAAVPQYYFQDTPLFKHKPAQLVQTVSTFTSLSLSDLTLGFVCVAVMFSGTLGVFLHLCSSYCQKLTCNHL